MHELRGLGVINDEMSRYGGSMLAISVDSPARSKQVVDRLKLPFPILADESREVIRKYGIVHSGGGPSGDDIAIPTLMLLDKDGRVLWERSAPNIMDRMDPKDVIAAVRSAFSARR